MAAMSLGFIVMVTPWTIQEVVAACTGSKVKTINDPKFHRSETQHRMFGNVFSIGTTVFRFSRYVDRN